MDFTGNVICCRLIWLLPPNLLPSAETSTMPPLSLCLLTLCIAGTCTYIVHCTCSPIRLQKSLFVIPGPDSQQLHQNEAKRTELKGTQE